MKKIILILFVIIFFLVGIIFLINKDKGDSEKNLAGKKINTDNQDKQLIGGQRDEHGCLGPAGYSWCEAKQKCLREWEEPCENEDIFAFLQKIKEETQLELSGIAPTNVFWKVELNDGQIAETMHKGRGMGMSDFSTENINKIKNYMLSKGYSLDKTNTLTDTEVLFDGYIMENRICTLSANSFKQDGKAEFTIDCADANLDDYKNFAVEDLKRSIKSQIIEKRGSSANDLVIKISKIYGDYSLGGAVPPVQGAGGGMWIGAKVNNNWKLVWDGNGTISCTDIDPYPNLPIEIVPECYDETKGELIIR
ncbi:hypothetical protein A2V49_01435 [candidate division WWE3 bacterium RBG_19FT_COMBO_34_6]|uniref:Uncharacterized protein n=1 Tax=candidate division WWE3 bacterium RBG_19FT_COMBO_34_6 TaxID=1802612 RepID=A0A1F4UJV4_UNCKA|nr:MAG: hypothetical protein A2V49_01435 [candidate division WWE3 bacterium RBG_19FT_COMBO_34_6]